MTQHTGLPVAGYQPQSDDNVALANELKLAEERYLRALDKLVAMNGTHVQGQPTRFDARCLAEARTCIQTGAMWAVRAIFQPQRIKLPEDQP